MGARSDVVGASRRLPLLTVYERAVLARSPPPSHPPLIGPEYMAYR